MRAVKWLFGCKTQSLNKEYTKPINSCVKILYSNSQTIREDCYRYTIELNEDIPIDKINEIISNGIK